MGSEATAKIYYGTPAIECADLWDGADRLARSAGISLVSVGFKYSHVALGWPELLVDWEDDEFDPQALVLTKFEAKQIERMHAVLEELKWPADKRKLAWRLAAHYG